MAKGNYRIVSGNVGDPIYAVWDDGTVERAYESQWGPNAGTEVPYIIPESLVSQYQGKSVAASNDPFANTAFMAASYVPATFRQSNETFVDKFAIPAFTLGLGGTALGFAGGGDAALTGAEGVSELAGADAAGGVADTLGADLGFTVDPVTGDTVLAGSAAGGGTSGGAAMSGGGAGTAATGGAVSKLSELTGLDQGTLELLGIGAGTGLGIYGADQKSDALSDIANQSRADRAPFREQSLAWLNDPNAFLEGPGKTAVDSVLRRLSVKGNPTGIPSSLALAGDFALNSWLDAVTGMGNLGLSGEDTRAQLQAGAADADSQKLDAIGYGIGQATTKRRNLADVLNSLV